MLHIKFKSSEHRNSEEEDFLLFFLRLNPGPRGVGPSWSQGLCLNKLGKGPVVMQCYILNFKHLREVIQKKIFKYFLCISKVPP